MSSGVTTLTERLGGGTGEFDVGAAVAVEGPERMLGDRRAVDKEQSGAATGKRSGDNEDVGTVTGEYRILAAGQRP